MIRVSSPKIFVVDDEIVIAQTLAVILERNGFEIKSYTNPLDALEAAAFDRPQLLLSDIAMPQLSGIDLAIRIQQICPECKILLISGQAATEGLLKAPDRERNFLLLSKPIHPTDLLKHIRALLTSSNA
jgi:DNA-binding NtrC family response regulator